MFTPIAPESMAAALRAQRAISKMSVAEVVDAAARICGSSPRTLQRRLDTAAGITLDEVNAFAQVFGVPASHLYKLAALTDSVAVPA